MMTPRMNLSAMPGSVVRLESAYSHAGTESGGIAGTPASATGRETAELPTTGEGATQ